MALGRTGDHADGPDGEAGGAGGGAEKRRRDSLEKRAFSESIANLMEQVEEDIETIGHLLLLSERLPPSGFTMLIYRDESTGHVRYSKQPEEHEAMARQLRAKLSQAVQEEEDIAQVYSYTTKAERHPRYLFPKMVDEVRGWVLIGDADGGFSTYRFSAEEVQKYAPVPDTGPDADEEAHEDDDLPKIKEEGEDEEYGELIYDNMNFDDPPRKLTQEELEEMDRRAAIEEEQRDGPLYAPEDEVRYF